MNTRAILTAPAKVNLYLAIEGLRPDGYHELTTVFYPVAEPADELAISPGRPGTGLELACSDPALETPDNLVAGAYAAHAEATDLAPDLRVELKKSVPSGAGLGGGSSDAAAMLMHLNALAGERGLGAKELSALGAGLGADVPFFLLGKPALATGIGEKLVPVDVDLSGLTMLLVLPGTHVPTGKAYASWDALGGGRRTRPAPPLFLTRGNPTDMEPVSTWPPVLYNSFERPVFSDFPGLRIIKEKLLRLGGSAAVMSGSGASVLSLFRNRNAALSARTVLERSDLRTCVLTL